MPNYHAWNTALIEHVTYGAPLGSTIYLEVSDETLTRVGVQRWGPPEGPGTWRGDFLAAVQKNTVSHGQVALDWMLADDPRGRPLGVAFLGAMVLAASNMAGDAAQAVHAKNYFRRLAEVLGLPVESQGRPPGLPPGAEEPLWRAWLTFLRSRGYDSTARGGEGPLRFIAYPISQTLIPAGEKQRLFRLFGERGYPPTWDGETLASRLRADGIPSAKLRELLARSGAAAEDVQSALQENLQAFHASGSGGLVPGMDAAFSTRQLLAGLYREEHWRTGEPEYRLFPRQPRGVRLTNMTVEVADGPEELLVERPGYYHPLGEVLPEQLAGGARYPVQGSAFVDALVLPARQHWLLRPDPDSAGMYASLGTPGVGEHLLLLVHEDLLADVKRFREEGLLAWSGEPERVGGGWLELRDVMVVGNHWADVPAGRAGALHEALRPAGGVSVRLEGGVRTQRAGAYLVGGAPRISVTSFFTEASLTVCRDGYEIYDDAVAPGEVLADLLDQPGEYELVAEARGTRAVRLVSVMSWEDLRASAVPHDPTGGTEVGKWNVLGAHVVAK